MTIETFWDTPEQTVIRHELKHSWTIPEFHNAMQTTNNMVETVGHDVRLIVDVRNSDGYPSGFLSALRATQNRRHPRIAMIIVVGGNLLITTFNKLYRQLYSSTTVSFAMVNTLDEAYDLIQQVS